MLEWKLPMEYSKNYFFNTPCNLFDFKMIFAFAIEYIEAIACASQTLF